MALKIGDTTVLVSDGNCKGKPNFQGFSLSLTVRDEAEADEGLRGARRWRPGADAARARRSFRRASAWSPTASASAGWSTSRSKRARKRRKRSTPSASRDSLDAKHQRTNPSPSGPNAMPGARPSPASATRRLQKSRLSVTFATRKNAYIAPGGATASTPGVRCRWRVQKIARLRATGRRCARSRARRRVTATTPARWTNGGAHDVLYSRSFARSGMSAGGATIQPSRHPVISHDFENVFVLIDAIVGLRQIEERRRRRASAAPPSKYSRS